MYGSVATSETVKRDLGNISVRESEAFAEAFVLGTRATAENVSGAGSGG